MHETGLYCRFLSGIEGRTEKSSDKLKLSTCLNSTGLKKSDPKLIYKGSVNTLTLMLKINCTRTYEPRQLTFVCLSSKSKKTRTKKKNKQTKNWIIQKMSSISGFSFHSCPLNQTKRNNHCVGRESNPGQLLGRQLRSPLYHRRFDVGVTVKNNIDFS